jgi:diketogulonate reductase-like aldo/keto reductase
LLSRHAAEVTDDGRQRLVRHGHLPEREIMTGIGAVAVDSCAQVIGAFFDSGGRLIDSSRMYGSSQKVIGYGLAKLDGPPSLFSADKVWISSGARGPDQIEAS